ncbi:MAG: hypothetical protein NC191_03265 [Muribaculaceae bacterium]|nr:hypothetical protein [Muribaculaceae bacterium]
MKKNLLLLGLALLFIASPSIAAPGPHGGHAPGVRFANHPGGMHRPPMHTAHHMARPLPPPPIHRHYSRIFRPYYPTTYYTSYSYYPTYPTYSYGYNVVEPVPANVNTVVVRDNYAGVNTAANVINTAANVAATIKYLSW